jgi:hypothetical protein
MLVEVLQVHINIENIPDVSVAAAAAEMTEPVAAGAGSNG